MLPTITLLAPVSPIAWLPIAIFLFGIGNKPAIFMVFIALLFTMVLATITQIDGVNRNLINVARTMGATKRQIYLRVIIPAILPGLLMVLRLNLFAAWMVVLVAEATGVGYGLGQVIMLARNTLNPSLVFFTITLIGLLGFGFDFVLRQIQRRVLYWVPQTAGVLRGALARCVRFSQRDAVVCRDVGKTWAAGTPRAHEALRDLDLDVAPGEFVVPARSFRLRQEHAAVYDRRARRSDRRKTCGRLATASTRRRRTAASSFRRRRCFRGWTVWQNVSFGLSIRGEPAHERKAAALAALQRVGLAEALNKRPDELSGGMRQRVAVARALAMRPKVLLMDEPFAALDVQTRAKMQDFLLDVWRDSGASVLFVTHHIDEAIALADRVVVFTARPGRIKTIVPVDLPRPRDPFSPSSEALRRQLTLLLRDEVDRAFAEQEKLPAA